MTLLQSSWELPIQVISFNVLQCLLFEAEWYSVTHDTITATGGGGMLRGKFNNNVIKALEATYPGMC